VVGLERGILGFGGLIKRIGKGFASSIVAAFASTP